MPMGERPPAPPVRISAIGSHRNLTVGRKFSKRVPYNKVVAATSEAALGAMTQPESPLSVI